MILKKFYFFLQQLVFRQHDRYLIRFTLRLGALMWKKAMKFHIFRKTMLIIMKNTLNRPHVLVLPIGTSCNLNCEYCYSSSTNQLNLAKRLSILKEASDLGIENICIGGGEPLIQPEFKTIMEAAGKMGFTLTIATNAIKLDNKTLNFLDKLKSKGCRIFIHVNYEPPETYDIAMGFPGGFQIIERNSISAIRRGFTVRPFITLTRRNARWLKSSLKRIESWGTYPVLERYIPVHGDDRDSALSIDGKTWKRALQLMEAHFKRRNLIHLEREVFAPLAGTSCGGWFHTLAIQNDGLVVPCVFAPPESAAGNILDEKLSIIWENYLRKRRLWHKIPKHCISCSDAVSCNGGCLSYRARTDGIASHDKLCVNYRGTHKW